MKLVKTCPRCGAERPITGFCLDKSRKDGRNPWCKECASEAARKRRENPEHREKFRQYQKIWARNPDRRSKQITYQKTDPSKMVKRKSKLKTKYEITLEQHAEMLLSQDNRCAVCRCVFLESKHTHVDHCHKTGVVRGVLCNHCNRALGAVRDSEAILAALICYLQGVNTRRTIIESPYAGDVEANTAYARACLRDSLKRGEAPYASHLLYTQPGVLDDLDPDERAHGIDAGLAWGNAAHLVAVYVDHGISGGMKHGIEAHEAAGRTVVYRTLMASRVVEGEE